MPCTPSPGLSHSYISQWLTMVHPPQSPDIPPLDPIPSPRRRRRPREEPRQPALRRLKPPRMPCDVTNSPSPELIFNMSPVDAPMAVPDTDAGESSHEEPLSSKTQPIPIPKPSPRLASDFGGVSSLTSAPRDSPMRFARAPRRPKRTDENVPDDLPDLPEHDVTGAWSRTADAVPTHAPRHARKKRLVVDSYDADMDSELSSWRAR
ncbi:hypothetical protein CTheo_3481 [Ceratobasidium theobromae]|uniref:Uncharacterized protein n=1 Tax=Ceratobasidium theobromae TaxID=1582974 RepID=A0A5N5QN76_9AGAM|nr:hypothetical protein CTheo_3481 [Ceratobasidium theobromae]